MASEAIPHRQVRLRDYRYPGEVLSLALTLGIIVALFVLGLWFFPSTWGQVVKALLIASLGLAVYLVTISVQQRAVFGTLVRVSPRQFPELHGLAATAAERLSTQPVPVYVKRQSEMNIYTLGMWGRPLIVVTSSLVDQMELDNLQFFIGREVGHVQAGHTWLRTLLRPLGAEVPVIGRLLNSVVFGDWINRAELTADRAGFIACRSLTTSVSTMLKFGVGIRLYEKLDIREFLEQIREVRNVGGHVTEIIAEQPYLTQRVRSLVRFALSEQFRGLIPERQTYTRILEVLPHGFVSSGTYRLDQLRAEQETGKIDPQATVDEAADETLSEPTEVTASEENGPDPRHLLVAAGTKEPHVLRSFRTRLGRNHDNDIVVNNDRVSRYHAEIIHEGAELRVVDVGSRNGVWVNGERIAGPTLLKPGDRLRIGRQEFVFTVKEETFSASGGLHGTE